MKAYTKKYINIEGNAGSLGAALIYEENKSEISTRFRSDYFGPFVSESDKSLPFLEHGIIEEVNRICREEGCGYFLHLRKIPVLQQTIEVCEMFSLNPYELPCHARITLTEKETPASCGYTTQELRKNLIRES